MGNICTHIHLAKKCNHFYFRISPIYDNYSGASETKKSAVFIRHFNKDSINSYMIITTVLGAFSKIKIKASLMSGGEFF